MYTNLRIGFSYNIALGEKVTLNLLKINTIVALKGNIWHDILTEAECMQSSPLEVFHKARQTFSHCTRGKQFYISL